jgi:prepilin-type N-terminal cleavage/methylation domain-containing protein/prepilin-type processing-associated H-X9-DG protein
MDKRAGFTLVELLVVIAIIALLMAILMPTLNRVRKQAKAVTCQSNLSQWGKIFMMYTVENNGYFASGSSGKVWTQTLEPYYSEPKLHCCPMAAQPAFPEGSSYPAGGKFLAWGAFDSTYAQLGLEGVYGSYGMNGHVSNPKAGVPDPWGRDTTKNWRSAGVNGASNIPLFLDCTWLGGLPEDGDTPPQEEGDCEFGLLGTNIQGFCLDRHNGAINGLFLDFSVRKIGLKELWKLKWHRKFDTSGWSGGWPEWMKHFKDD